MLKKIVVASLAPLVLCPVLLAADWKVVIREWDVPTPNSRPHDPEVAPDGALWYTGQLANKLGRLNPATGAIKEFLVKTRDSGPHGLAADKDGNIWFTANSKSYIGKLDPSTGTVTEYPMPDPAARDPHSLVFDRDGMIFFTVQNGNFVGRLDPKTGKVVLKAVPTPRARPYGIIVGPDGAAYFCEFGSNKIGRVDPKTLEITEYTLPEGARPRRITNNPDRFIYYSDFGRGFIGRLEPRSGKVEEWPSPGGPESRPYGIASTADGMVWYSESGVKPNALVVFDPRGKSFQIWPIPSGGGVVRNMVATPDGRLYLACSGVNKVAIATPTRHKAAGLEDLRGSSAATHGGGIGSDRRLPVSRIGRRDPSTFMDRIAGAMRASGYSGAAVARVRGGNRGLIGRHQTRREGVLRGRTL